MSMEKKTEVCHEKISEILAQRTAHDVVSPLSSLCMIAETLDEMMYAKLLQIIKLINFMKISCQQNVTGEELRSYYSLFHRIDVIDEVNVDERAQWLKHLLLWIYSKQNKQTEIYINGNSVKVKNLYINEEETSLLEGSVVEYNYHNIYLVRFIEKCKDKYKYHVGVDEIDIKIM